MYMVNFFIIGIFACGTETWNNDNGGDDINTLLRMCTWKNFFHVEHCIYVKFLPSLLPDQKLLPVVLLPRHK